MTLVSSADSEHLPNPVVDVNLPLSSGDTTRLRVVNGVDTSREVALTSSYIITSDCCINPGEHIVFACAILLPSTYHR
jgi:hypothetical protein